MSRRWLEEQAAKALRENPNLISGDELMRRMAAEQAARQREAEHAEIVRQNAAKLEELKAIRRLLEEGKSSSS